jgi:two-component system LytT family sensor kinase
MRTGNRRLYYWIFGLLFFLFWGLFKLGGIPDFPQALSSTAIDVLVTMMVLGITVEGLLPRLLYQKKTAYFIICFMGLVFLGGSAIILSQLRLFDSSLSRYQENVIRSPKHFYYWFWSDLVFGSYFLVCFIPGTGAAIRLAFDRMAASNKVEKLQKEAALSELELLKHQINPHFLFNALNTIYYKIDRSNTGGREALQRFSHMLRYQLYECDKPMVEVEKELSFIRTYIEWQRVRLNDNYQVTCTGLEEVKGFPIAPFILMPLVENCFKHVSAFPDKPNLIFIDSHFTEDGFFLLHTGNTIAEKATPGGGIGLGNIKRRLELIYPGRYELTIAAGTELYEVTLKLPYAPAHDYSG